jgi:hypothetical protein
LATSLGPDKQKAACVFSLNHPHELSLTRECHMGNKPSHTAERGILTISDGRSQQPVTPNKVALPVVHITSGVPSSHLSVNATPVIPAFRLNPSYRLLMRPNRLSMDTFSRQIIYITYTVGCKNTFKPLPPISQPNSAVRHRGCAMRQHDPLPFWHLSMPSCRSRRR